MKFFSYFAAGNSKGVGEMNLDFNEDCHFLQTMPYKMVSKDFIIVQEEGADRVEWIHPDQMITASVCGGTSLKIRSFDLFPDLLLNVTHAHLLSTSSDVDSQTILVTSSNAYNHTSYFTLYLSTSDSMRNEGGDSFDPLVVVVFLAVLPSIFILLLLSINRKANK